MFNSHSHLFVSEYVYASTYHTNTNMFFISTHTIAHTHKSRYLIVLVSAPTPDSISVLHVNAWGQIYKPALLHKVARYSRKWHQCPTCECLDTNIQTILVA